MVIAHDPRSTLNDVVSHATNDSVLCHMRLERIANGFILHISRGYNVASDQYYLRDVDEAPAIIASYIAANRLKGD